jgi:hypothetical protein
MIKKEAYYVRVGKKETTCMQEKNLIGGLPIRFFE